TTPTNQTHSQSDSLKLQAQPGTNDDRFHALKLEGNTMGSNGEVQNTGKNLTLGDGTRIEVKLDSSIKAESSNGGGKPEIFSSINTTRLFLLEALLIIAQIRESTLLLLMVTRHYIG
ncbi:hypothetical protein, partial [Helicobacter bilis]|uniref:hypothetical protein n=1 Tax=Helicobacter bilis TaxID=37372 RepID=UPI0025A9C8D2